MCVGRKFGVRCCVTKRCKFDKASTANSVWQVFVGKTTHGYTTNLAWQVWRNGRCLWAKRKWSSVWAGDFSLSLSLSLSLLALLARLWAKFKGLFYLFYCSFLSSFCLQKTFFRTLCFCEIFKRFVFELFALVIDSRFRKNGGFCHFERSEKSIL